MSFQNPVSEKHVPVGYNPELYKIRHSLAHVMAQAVLERFPEALLAIGPPIKDGFYYDFDLPRPLTPDDLADIEAHMRGILAGNHRFNSRVVSADEAKAIFANQPYKLELIAGLEQGGVDENGNPLNEPPVISIYQHDSFVDLCRGPHVEHTGQLNPQAFKLLTVAGAYWRGDEHRPMLQRIYGTAWESADELAHYLWLQAELERRDHRRIGKELDLFHLDPTAPGMPYWLPNGWRLFNTLLDFWRKAHEAWGYVEFAGPSMNESRLYDVSGHSDHYNDNMFYVPISEHQTFALKPMNCPNAMIVYGLRTRSYRDLPLRLSDCDVLFRRERSGTLHGLMRVQFFRQDDSHNFVREDQIEAEFDQILDEIDLFYRIFGLKYWLRFGTRPDGFIGEIETWNRAEAMIQRILDRRGGDYKVEPKDGAFYGPKIDIVMEDALGREWQMGTVQLDFQLPERFDLSFVDRDGSLKRPVVVHRVIYGSFERFIGILIEHFAGAFPVWLAPLHACVMSVSEKHSDYASGVAQQLKAAGLRVEVDDSNERVGAKIRNAQLRKIPYMLIVGQKEIEANQVSVRLRTEVDLGAMPIHDFIEMAQAVIANKSLELKV